MRSGKTFSEAGKMGAKASLRTRKKNKNRRIEEYNCNPIVCKQCGSVLPYEKRRCKFCNKSCAAKFNNKGTNRHGTSTGYCKNCGKKLNLSIRKFCSTKCSNEFRIKRNIEMWLNGEKDGVVSRGLSTSSFIKRWVTRRCGNKCEICGTETWMEKDVPLILDHIDGNGLNNSPENLRMVCGNCDMQLPTYKARNLGRGRAKRRSRYISGKSY